MLSDIFTDIFTIRENALTHVDPRIKIVIAAAAMAFALMAASVAFPLLLLVMSIGATVAVKVPLRFVILRLAPALGIASVIFVLKAFTVKGGALTSFTMFSWELTATFEGATQGAVIAVRMMGALAVLQLLSVTTAAHQIFRSLEWFGVPHGWIEVAMLIYRYTFELFDSVVNMSLAQKVRLGYSNSTRSLASAGTVAGSAFLVAADKACHTAEAMNARGFNGTIHFDPMKAICMKQLSIGAATIITLALLYFACGAI